MTLCKICGNSASNSSFTAREMMFGLRDEFEYFECSVCGCVQISEIPKDMKPYYPANYYSFTKLREPAIGKMELFYIRLKTKLNLSGIKAFPIPDLPMWVKVSKLPIRLRSKILDVGCGNGRILLYLSILGFTNLTGIDPYVKEDQVYNSGIQILKKDLSQVEGLYDFIMLNHSFEHVENPLETLCSAANLIRSNGWILIRIPTVSSYAWREYKQNWVQLDAPRHFFLHSTASMEILARQAGLVIESVFFDSHSFQLWGSEQYLRDIPLYDARSLLRGIPHSIFTQDTIKDYEKKAEHLNQTNDGDQACFLLKRK